MSNHATCTVRSDGKYSISAVDLNGNSTKVSFTVDVIGKLTTTTKTTTKTTTTTTTTAATAPQAKPVYGDANCDGSVKLNDAILVMQTIGNPDSYGVNGTDPSHITEQGVTNADVANTGDNLTNADALAIQEYLLKLISVLPKK